VKVNRHELVEGCILTQDVYGKTQTPVMLKNTVLTPELLDVLYAFSVEEINVAEKLESGDPFTPMKRSSRSNDSTRKARSSHEGVIQATYDEAVKRFKDQFSQWQNGAPINILGLQGILLSILQSYSKKPYDLFQLHEKTTEADYTFHHSVSVGLISAYLASKLKYPRKTSLEVGLAGLLIDCGMAKIPPHYLFKTKELNEGIAQQLTKHPIFGYQMLKKDPMIEEGIVLTVLQHHEREDGSGYPLGVSGAQLHPYAKIVMVVDSYHALVSQRHYREQQSPFTALDILNKDIAKYDPRTLLVLTQEIVHVFVGSRVKLSNDERGEIIFIPNDSPTRPMIRLDDGRAIALSQHPSLLIYRIL
jgi:HD-GYP domain-containing protein (c-di-GMP phosphodiesterase class II)